MYNHYSSVYYCKAVFKQEFSNIWYLFGLIVHFRVLFIPYDFNIIIYVDCFIFQFVYPAQCYLTTVSYRSTTRQAGTQCVTRTLMMWTHAWPADPWGTRTGRPSAALPWGHGWPTGPLASPTSRVRGRRSSWSTAPWPAASVCLRTTSRWLVLNGKLTWWVSCIAQLLDVLHYVYEYALHWPENLIFVFLII